MSYKRGFIDGVTFAEDIHSVILDYGFNSFNAGAGFGRMWYPKKATREVLKRRGMTKYDILVPSKRKRK